MNYINKKVADKTLKSTNIITLRSYCSQVKFKNPMDKKLHILIFFYKKPQKKNLIFYIIILLKKSQKITT